MNPFPPSPGVSHEDCFEFYQKFAEIFASQGAPPVSTPPVANLPKNTGINDTGSKFSTGINDTGGKFATGVNDTGGKFAAGVNNTGGNLLPVSTTPVANNGNNIRLLRP
jgi:hypothetical protein